MNDGALRLVLVSAVFARTRTWLGSESLGKRTNDRIEDAARRRELLSLYTTDFTVCVSDFDESAVTAPTPAQLVEQLAIGKCLAVAKQHPDAVVIGCDTVVDVDGAVFGKPHDAEDAKRMLRALSGKTHQVHTGVCIAKGDRAEHFVDSCKVTFFPLGEEEIAFYAATPEPYDKAGAYAIQVG